ncbi:MAG: amidohydrolase [Deltaproteobacteria bacterium]|nr:amidohydrolase [Deltaproteobacteria bacterium]
MKGLKTLVRRLLLLGAAVGALLLASRAATRIAHGPTLYVGGPVLTMDGDSRVAQALAIDGDKVVATGTDKELRTWAKKAGAHVVDLGGRAILPGFVDGHSHFPASGLFEKAVHVGSPPLGSVRNIEQMVAALSARALESDEHWIVGWGYDDTLLEDNRHPTRYDLDKVSRDRPVVVWHVSFHIAALNSRALEELGMTHATPDPAGGRIRRIAGNDAGNTATAGEPDGVLEEEATRPVFDSTLKPSSWEAVLIARRAAATYLAAGVTTAQDGAATGDQVQGLALMSRLGLLPLRVVVWPEGQTAEQILDGELDVRAAESDWFRLGAVKLVDDGSIQAYTAYLTKPYFRVPGGADPATRGYPRIARDELMREVVRFHKAGWQIAVHGNGDAAIDDILDALEAAQKQYPRSDSRPVIVHAQMTRDDQLDRMKKLGVVPSFFPLHTFFWGDRHRDRFLGPERAARISPTAGAAARGIRFSIHADTPVLPMEPLRIVASAVTRRAASGAVLGPDQRIGVMQALRAITIDAAYQAFLEAKVGSLEPGKLADFVILDRSPLDDPDHIENIRVLETFVSGRSAHQAQP